MGYLTTKDIAEATDLTVRQIQYYVEKNVIKAKTRKSGRGRGYLFIDTDIVKFLILKEVSRFGMSLEKMSNLLHYFTIDIKNLENVKKYINEKLFLENVYYNLTVEYPIAEKEKDEKYFYGHLIYNPDDPDRFPDSFFKQTTNDDDDDDSPQRFNGYNFEEGSLSTLIIDVSHMLEKQYNFLEKNPGTEFPDDDIIPERKARRKG